MTELLNGEETIVDNIKAHDVINSASSKLLKLNQLQPNVISTWQTVYGNHQLEIKSMHTIYFLR